MPVINYLPLEALNVHQADITKMEVHVYESHSELVSVFKDSVVTVSLARKFDSAKRYKNIDIALKDAALLNFTVLEIHNHVI